VRGWLVSERGLEKGEREGEGEERTWRMVELRHVRMRMPFLCPPALQSSL
jgi:hypothetical protein